MSHDHVDDHHQHLNPALAGARFCPRCGSPAEVDYPRSIACPTCGYQAYFNPKPVACAIPRDDRGNVILLRRGYRLVVLELAVALVAVTPAMIALGIDAPGWDQRAFIAVGVAWQALLLAEVRRSQPPTA